MSFLHDKRDIRIYFTDFHQAFPRVLGPYLVCLRFLLINFSFFDFFFSLFFCLNFLSFFYFYIYLLIDFSSIIASTAFIYGLIPENKKALAVYPCFLFFIILDWIALAM